MSETAETGTEEQTEFSAITSQAALDAILKDRLTRERSKFSDYKDLKDKASKFDELEAEKLSEIDKANRRAEQAEQEANQLRLSSLKFEVASSKGVPAALLQGSNKEELEALADALIAFRGEATKTRTPEPDPSQGGNKTPLPLNGDGLENALRGKLGIK